jgi:predicted metal-binding membrane protein
MALLSGPAPDEVDRFAWLRPASSLGRARLGLLASLAALTAAAWALTLHEALRMGASMGIAARGELTADGMAGMAMGGIAATGWSLEGAATFVAVWTVMMAAMMLPAAAPMILIFASAQARRTRDIAVPTWVFVAGYILVWMAVGLLVYVLVQAGSEMAPPQPGGSGRLGAPGTRSTADRSRALPVHSAQARLPQSLPLAFRLRGAALA